MTLNEIMLGNIQSNKGAAILQIGSKPLQKSGEKSEDSAFGEILGSRINKAADRQVDVKRNDLKEPRFLTFKDANKQNLKTATSDSTIQQNSKLGESQDQLSEVDDDTEKDITKDKQCENKQNNMLYIFSQVLGLNINDLQKLLKESGISPDSFNNMKNINENAAKLSQVLGLNNTQQDTLVKMLQLAAETLDSFAVTAVDPEAVGEEILPTEIKAEAKTIETDGAAKAQRSSSMEESRLAQPLASDFESLSADLESKIKMKLNEFSYKLNMDQSATEAELKQLIQQMFAKAAVKIQESQQKVLEVNTEDALDQFATVNDLISKTATAQDDSSGDNDRQAQEDNANSVKQTVIQQSVSASEEIQTQAAFTVIQPEKVNVTDTAAITDAKIPAEAKEIISQVIENAKVILTPDKSEMVMDLKPDSLGKISLKVVTENGIVMAKFVAENQQVRQVLEANMQLLKDSLERQGMNVQGFSVSVRQDSRQSNGSWSQPEKSRSRSITGAEYRTAGVGGSLEDILDSTGISNPYKWGISTINLTA